MVRVSHSWERGGLGGGWPERPEVSKCLTEGPVRAEQAERTELPGPGRNRRRGELWEGQDEKSKRGPGKKEGFDRCLRMSGAEMRERSRASAEVRKEGFVWGNGKKMSCSFAPCVKGSLVLWDRRKRNKCVKVARLTLAPLDWGPAVVC